MEQNISYTDKIVEEILNKEIVEKDWSNFISHKYTKKGFTLIGIRREIRIVRERICYNTINRFDIISGSILAILSSFIAFLLGENVLGEGSIMKFIFPLITLCIVGTIISLILMNMKEKSKLYTMCIDNLSDLQRCLEDEYTKVELRKILEDDYIEGSIFNKDIDEDHVEDDNSIEIESFDFTCLDDEEKTECGVA